MDYTTLPQYWINHLGFLIRKQLVREFATHGHRVSAEEWAALLILQGGDGLTSTDLSNASIRDKTTVTRLVDKLVAKHLVARRPDGVDRRVIRLHLTDHGRATFTQLAEIAKGFIDRSLHDISDEAVKTTVATLSKMTDNLNQPKESGAKDGL